MSNATKEQSGDDYNRLYEENADFRGYVDRYCKKYVEGKSITLEEALEHEIVKQYAEQLENQTERYTQ